jgi:hypothetical protein
MIIVSTHRIQGIKSKNISNRNVGNYLRETQTLKKGLGALRYQTLYAHKSLKLPWTIKQFQAVTEFRTVNMHYIGANLIIDPPGIPRTIGAITPLPRVWKNQISNIIRAGIINIVKGGETRNSHGAFRISGQFAQ